MGAASAVEFTHSSSLDSLDKSGTDRSSFSSLPSFMRRRSLSLLSTENGSRRPSTNVVPPLVVLEPVKANVLNVPVYERHPFSEYIFQKKLGEGSFATVFKCIQTNDQEIKVAIKEINIKSLGKQQLQDINTEMNILSQLDHESIVQIYAVYSIPEKLFMVTEYLRGGELLTAICKRDHYHERDARRIMWQITSALQYLHSRKVIHRDIKPMNLILTERSFESSVKIADFGFATIDCEDIRRPGRFLCGTPGYIAPEVLTYRAYSPKVDMWSLGIVLYVLLSGYMPFPADEAGEEHVKRGRIVFPPARFSRVSHAAKDLIMRLLTVTPEQRLSASQVLQHPWMAMYAPPTTYPQHPEKPSSMISRRPSNNYNNGNITTQQYGLVHRDSNASATSGVSSSASSRRPSNPNNAGGTHSPSTVDEMSGDNAAAEAEAVGAGKRRKRVVGSKPHSEGLGTKDWSMMVAAQVPPPNSLALESRSLDQELEGDGEDDNEEVDDEEDDEEEEYDAEYEQDGDLSENLEWIRRYHASEQQPPTFAGRLWQSIRSKLTASPTFGDGNNTNINMANVTSNGSTPRLSNGGGGGMMNGDRRSSREQQHHDILMALSERELQRQFEEFQEREQRQQQKVASSNNNNNNSALSSARRISDPLQQQRNNAMTSGAAGAGKMQLPALSHHSSPVQQKPLKEQQLGEGEGNGREGEMAVSGSSGNSGKGTAVSYMKSSGKNEGLFRSPSMASTTGLGTPGVFSSTTTGVSAAAGVPTSSSSSTPFLVGTGRTAQSMVAVASPPLTSRQITPRLSLPLTTTSGSTNNSRSNTPVKLPRVAQKYGSGSSSNSGHSNDSLYHPPQMLLAYSR